MPMVHLDRVDKVRVCLAEVSGLADGFSARQYDFPNRVCSWLVRLEAAANEARLDVVPRLSGLRVAIEAARQGLDAGDGIRGQRARRRAQHAAAQTALQTAITLVSSAIEPFEARRLCAEDIALNIVARSFEKRLWPGQRQDKDAPRDIPSMWRALLSDPTLGPLTMELSALLGFPQSMVLIARTMSEFAGAPANHAQTNNTPA